MKYDFSTTINRTGVGSYKWDQMKKWNPNVSPDIIPFSVADMELPNPIEIIAGLKDYLSNVVLGYTGPTQAYYEAVIGWMQRRHNWSIQKEWMVQTAGVVSAFFNAVNVFSKPGDGIMYFTPAYYPFVNAITRQGRRQVGMPLKIEGGRYYMDFDLLEEKTRDPRNGVLLFCSPHNPVGRVWERTELERLVDICVRNNVMMVSDEIHFDLVLPPHKHIVLSTVSEQAANQTIVLTAPSKTFNLAGVQCSNVIICNEAIRNRFNDGLASTGFFSLNLFAYKACEIAYVQCESWLDQLLALIYANHLIVKEFFAKHMPQLKVFDLEGTYLQWMDFRPLGLDAGKLETLMHFDAQVFMDEGYVFGEEGIGFERLNLAAPTTCIHSACQRIFDAVKPLL